MLDVLFWVSVFSGGCLILLLLLSLVGSIDLDIDLDGVDSPDGDSGGVGLVKGGLTFLSVGSWVFRILLVYNQPTSVSLLAGIVTGAVAVYLLAKLLGVLLSQQEENVWSAEDAIGQSAKVYLKITPEKSGIVQVEVASATRDFKAKSKDGQEHPTNSIVLITGYEDPFLLVENIQ